LVAAARLARYGTDFPTMERLARAAFTAKATAEAALLLGDALHNLGGPAANEEADRILAVGQEIAGADERILVELTGLRCRHLMANLQRPDEALEVNRAIRARTTGARGRDQLDSDRGLILCLSNRPLEGLEVLDGLAHSADPRTRVQTASMRPNALILTGRCEAGLAASRQAFGEHLQLGDEVAIVSAGSHFINEAYALTEMGRFQEAIDLGTFGYEAASKGGHRIGRYWFALGLGRTALLAGRARMARDRLAEAARLSEEDGSEAPGRVAFSLLAAVEAWLGDRDAAVNAARTVDSLPSIVHLEAEQVVGPAWTAVVTGDTRRGRELLLAAADRAAVSGSRAPEAWLRHEVARLGDAASVADRLEELGAVCEGALVPAYGFHARAAVRQDPEQLEEASRRFEATGALLLAAEAATSAGRAHQRARTQKAATANFARAAALARRCEGARTPGLLTTAAVVPLTEREREIARLAASGTTSREIAERLYLSVRTVENHLQSAYTKLGVASRAELADAFRTGL
jgi:DNA-binding CsgD family transcriptional regulator